MLVAVGVAGDDDVAVEESVKDSVEFGSSLRAAAATARGGAASLLARLPQSHQNGAASVAAAALSPAPAQGIASAATSASKCSAGAMLPGRARAGDEEAPRTCPPPFTRLKEDTRYAYENGRAPKGAYKGTLEG